MRAIDLNADLGEGAPGEAELFAWATSVNIACGGHAGDASQMCAALRAARAAGVAVGAHPGYEDREHFGRRELDLPPGEVTALVVRQVGVLAGFAAAEGLRLQHVKPHGALYNQAARDAALADAVVAGVVLAAPGAGLFAPPGSALAMAGEAAGLAVWPEGFADRAYLPDGRLAPRREAGAVLSGGDAVAQALLIAGEGRVRTVSGDMIQCEARTLCVHGDGADAAKLLRAVRAALEAGGFAVISPA